MKTKAVLAALILAAATSSHAAAWRMGGIEVSQAWSRPAAAGMTGVAYFTVRNTGPKPVSLTAVESPIAAAASIHQTTMTGGVSRMAPSGPVLVAPGQTAQFKPAGRHVMLEKLKSPLKTGDRVPAVLVFSNGARVEIELTVSPTPPGDAAMAGMEHKH